MSAAAVEQDILRAAPFAPRLLAGLRRERAVSLDEHLVRHGALDPAVPLLAALDASGLTGRGGAGFPTSVKVRAVASRKGRPIVVVNAAEGEPLSGKDRVLLRHLPHLVLDGAVALAEALGAREIVIAHSRRAVTERAAIEAALRERAARRLDRRLDIRASALSEGFVSGQETAIVRFLNGGPARPTSAPPLPFESGVDRRPTLIQNAETVAQVALIARYGADWFRAAGTEAEPGSALFTISGAVARPGVHEAELGSPLRDLLGAAGGVRGNPRAFLIGGYSGAWIDARAASELVLDEASLRELGGTLGVGAIAVLPDTACGLCETARVARFLASESAGQCGPCVHGLAAIAGSLERALHGRPASDRAVLDRRLDEVTGRGACRHPDGAARFVASALKVFEAEIDRHAPQRCPRGTHAVLPIPARGRQ